MKKMTFKKQKTLHFYDEIEGLYIKSYPKRGYFGKYPGSPPFPIKYGAPAVVRAILGKNEITKKEFDKAA